MYLVGHFDLTYSEVLMFKQISQQNYWHFSNALNSEIIKLTVKIKVATAVAIYCVDLLHFWPEVDKQIVSPVYVLHTSIQAQVIPGEGRG